MSLYWFTNGVCTIATSTFLKNSRVRKFFKISTGKPVTSVTKVVPVSSKLKAKKTKTPNTTQLTFGDTLKANFDVIKEQNPDHPLVKAMVNRYEKIEQQKKKHLQANQQANKSKKRVQG